MRYLCLLSLLVFFSCSEFDYSETYKIDPALDVFVNSFYNEAEIRGIHLDKNNLIVRLHKNPNNEINPFTPGVSIDSYTQRVVLIDEWSFNSFSYNERELLVFHELGHALLSLPHCECPTTSIMNQSPDFDTYSIIGRDIALDYLFNHNK